MWVTLGQASPREFAEGSKAGRGRGVQAALLVDLIRAAAYLRQEGINPSKIFLAGHSMGAGLSLVLAPLLKNVCGVAVAAPAVKQLMEFPLNPSIHLKSDVLGRNYKEAADFFRTKFPDAANLHLIGGNQDQIVKPLEVRPCRCKRIAT